VSTYAIARLAWQDISSSGLLYTKAPLRQFRATVTGGSVSPVLSRQVILDGMVETGAGADGGAAGDHWSLVRPVPDSDLTAEDRRLAQAGSQRQDPLP